MSTKNDTTWGDLGGAAFMTQDDLPEPKGLHIQKFTREEVGQGDTKETKTIVHWAEDIRPLVASKTALKQIQAVTGAKLPKEAIGQPVGLYVDPTVSFGGKIVGGIRVRAPSL